MTSRLVALSIDLDPLDLYLGLFALKQPLSDHAIEAIPARASERFSDLCGSLGIKGTLFVVGQDLSLGRGHAQLRAAATAGHEIASHSFSHDYALSRGSVEAIEDDLVKAEREIEAVIGRRPTGFRAPGYTVSKTLTEAIRRRGYGYDSSLLPSPPYYGAKALVIGALRALGKRSRSILGHPGQLFRRRQPHRDASGVLELPIAVLPGLRIPFYGTPIVAAPEWLTRLQTWLLQWDELVVVELHGVDLCDASDGIPPELMARQRDLRISASIKRKRIEAAMKTLLRNREGLTLADCARRLRG